MRERGVKWYLYTWITDNGKTKYGYIIHWNYSKRHHGHVIGWMFSVINYEIDKFLDEKQNTIRI